MEPYYLAVDIGASSGRHILGRMVNGRMELEEVYRFSNGMQWVDGHLCWDLNRLFSEVLEGLRRCDALGKRPVSMGIDTWAVDGVLLDENGEVLGHTYGYRDHRTEGMEQQVSNILPLSELYRRTGIQKQPFNTVYQLMATKCQESELFERAASFLLIPDYLDYCLTGVKKTEYTNATTTQLVSLQTGDWDWELLDKLGYPRRLFGTITMPGTSVGCLKREVEEAVGFSLEVVQTATHDTASAVLAVPALTDDFLYISSGTWSLMGTERKQPLATPESENANFTNEGGYEKRFRFLKNIMGLWMIQSVRHELDDRYSFAELCAMAKDCAIPSRVDVNDARFLAPERMIDAIRGVCRESGQPIPETPGELAHVIYHSLAESYAQTVREIEQLTQKRYEAIHIVGGGSNAAYLNELTAKAAQKTVYSGPAEATAIGNLLVQLLKDQKLTDVMAARRFVFDSFAIETYQPIEGGM